MPSWIPTFNSIYERLFDRYGPQAWWPAQGRFEIALGAVLTQGTAWTNAAKAIRCLKEAGADRPETLARLSEAALARHIRPAGFHNVKAARLMAFTAWWLDNGGHRGLNALPTATLRASLLAVNGVGRETADAIVLYAFQRRVFVIDAYARRVFSRVGLVSGDEKYEHLRAKLEDAFTGEAPECNEYHALIVEHGKVHCRSRPLCEGCPLAGLCEFRKRTAPSPAGGRG